jgi:hypothetical protein
MSGKVKQFKNYTTEQVEKLFESDENNIVGVKLYAIIQLSRGYSSRKGQLVANFASSDMNPAERVGWYMRKCITHNRYLAALKERIAKFWQLFSGCLTPQSIIAQIMCN